jgi:hypothetical protein
MVKNDIFTNLNQCTILRKFNIDKAFINWEDEVFTALGVNDGKFNEWTQKGKLMCPFPNIDQPTNE